MRRLLFAPLFALFVLCRTASAQADVAFYYDPYDSVDGTPGWWHVMAIDGMGIPRFDFGVTPAGQLRGDVFDTASHCIRRLSLDKEAASIDSSDGGFMISAGKDVVYYIIDPETKLSSSPLSIVAGGDEAIDVSSYRCGIYIIVVEHEGMIATFRRFKRS
jgi:hypothetical protein